MEQSGREEAERKVSSIHIREQNRQNRQKQGKSDQDRLKAT